MVDKYRDPGNRDEIIESIKNCPTVGDAKKIIDKVFPGWIVKYLEGYSEDYTIMDKHWETVCKKTGTTKKQIMIVDDVKNDEQHKLVKFFCEFFTVCGFCVRMKREYFPCEKCGLALAQPCLYDILKNDSDKYSLPERWSKICTSC